MSNPPPEELELRARPRPIHRLNKRTLMIGAAVLILLMAGATILALDPPSLLAPPARSELYNTDRKQTADGLAKLPKSYAEVPVLGPPVPGYIGRAFVEGEKRLGIQPPASDAPIRPNPEDEAERAERMRHCPLRDRRPYISVLDCTTFGASFQMPETRRAH